MVRRIRIRDYKSLRNVDVSLDRLVVLFGPNAAGKSNFIDALQLLSRIASSRTLKEAFEPPYRGKPMESFSFGETGLEGLLQRKSASFIIEADIELSPFVIEAVNREILETKRGHSKTNGDDGAKDFIRHHRLRYRIEVAISPKTGLLHVHDEYVAALGRNDEPRKSPQPFVELDRAGKDRLCLRMEGQAHPAYFDRYLDHAIISRPFYAPHYPHLTALKKELQSWFFYYFEPRERMRAPVGVKEVRHIGLMGEDLAAFLNTLKELDPKQFNAVQKALHALIPSITGIRTEVNKVGEVELSVMEGGVAMPARVISEGTLRVLGLLALSGAKEPPALIGFEEPENGVHPRRIADIAKILIGRAESGRTQVLVTTHSPILPDHIPDQYLFICRKLGGKTEIEPFDTWGPLGRLADIDSGLTDRSEQPISLRMLRGDFDA
ncbi:MAG: AAA family ATPase [Bryobacteraceae bacterium]